MKLRNVLVLAIMALLLGCETMNFGLNNRLDFAYKSVTAYTKQAKSLLVRERISVEQAERASANAKRAKASLDFVRGVGQCPGEPCMPEDQLLMAEDILLQLEAELKAKEKL